MKTKIVSFIKEWLLHFASLVFLFNFFDSLDFLSKKARWGKYGYSNYGKSETVFDRIIRHTFHNVEIFEMMAFTLLVELLYRFVFKKYRWPVFLISSVLCSCMVLTGHAWLTDKTFTGILQPLFILIGYMVGYALLREFFHHKLYALDARLGRSESQLSILKQQLDPHFLFNTLNYLYGTALQEKATRTAEGIEVMAGLMRYNVTGMQEKFVPLADEINFIEQYVYLQRVRLPANKTDDLKVIVNVGADNNLFIAPMLFVPFVENAFKHGVSTDNTMAIYISIATNGSDLKIQISNTVFKDNIVQGTNSGINLVRRRLELLYPERHQLDIFRSDDRYEVSLVIKLKSINK